MKVVINGAMTVDGKIATAAGDSAISSKEDLVRVHKLRASVDAILVGISTILADDPRLTVRLAKGRNPTRVVVDSRARIPLEANVLRTAAQVRTIIAVTSKAPEDNISRIRESGAEVLVVKEGSDQTAAVPQGVDLRELISELERMGIKRMLVEGGGELNWSLLRLGMVDELVVTVAPKIAGGRLATTIVEGDGFDRISDGIRLALGKVTRRKSGELVLHYRPR